MLDNGFGGLLVPYGPFGNPKGPHPCALTVARVRYPGRSMNPGTVVHGKYRVVQRIAHGGAWIFHASLGHGGQEVALKLSKRSEPDAGPRFTYAARLLSQLAGQGAPRIFDLFAIPSGESCHVMDLLQGHDLAMLLGSHGRLPLVNAVAYALQACEALAILHASGVVHGDIKPGHLFATASPEGLPIVKVLDFGYASAPSMGLAAPPGRPSGTALGYSAPEILSGGVTPASDQFSLGAVLFETLTGTRAFGPLAPGSVGAAPDVRRGEPSVPAGLAAVLARALAPYPQQRFASVAELARALVPFGPPNYAAYAERATALLGEAMRAAPLASAVPPAPPFSGPPIAAPPAAPALEGSPSASAGPPLSAFPFAPLGDAVTRPASTGFSLAGVALVVLFLIVGVAAINRYGARTAAVEPELPPPPPTPSATGPLYRVDPTPIVNVPVALVPAPSASAPSGLATCAELENKACRKGLAAAAKAREWKPVKDALLPHVETLGCTDLQTLKTACAETADPCASSVGQRRTEKRCR